MDLLRDAFREIEYQQKELFIFHVAFLAENEIDALDNADLYAEALNLLRSEVDRYTAHVSRNGACCASVPVYCGAQGPDTTDICIDRCHHSGRHLGPGATKSWTDADLDPLRESSITEQADRARLAASPLSWSSVRSRASRGASRRDEAPVGAACDRAISVPLAEVNRG